MKKRESKKSLRENDNQLNENQLILEKFSMSHENIRGVSGNKRDMSYNSIQVQIKEKSMNRCNIALFISHSLPVLPDPASLAVQAQAATYTHSHNSNDTVPNNITATVTSKGITQSSILPNPWVLPQLISGSFQKSRQSLQAESSPKTCSRRAERGSSEVMVNKSSPLPSDSRQNSIDHAVGSEMNMPKNNQSKFFSKMIRLKIMGYRMSHLFSDTPRTPARRITRKHFLHFGQSFSCSLCNLPGDNREICKMQKSASGIKKRFNANSIPKYKMLSVGNLQRRTFVQAQFTHALCFKKRNEKSEWTFPFTTTVGTSTRTTSST